MSLSLVTAPRIEPVTVDTAKLYARITSSDTTEDALVESFIVAARQYVETVTGRALITQTWDWKEDAFEPDDDGRIVLPKAPLQSVTSVTYIDTAGVSTVWPASSYSVVTHTGPEAQPGTLEPVYGGSYPATRYQSAGVVIRFVAGYGPAPGDVPAGIQTAIRMLILEMFDRGDSAVAAGTSGTVLTVQRLLQPFRVW